MSTSLPINGDTGTAINSILDQLKGITNSGGLVAEGITNIPNTVSNSIHTSGFIGNTGVEWTMAKNNGVTIYDNLGGVNGTSGGDTIKGSDLPQNNPANNWAIDGGSGNDYIDANGLPFTNIKTNDPDYMRPVEISGGEGNDTLVAARGDAVLNTLYGFAGTDQFVVGKNMDVFIGDFDRAEGDKIALADGIAFADLKISQVTDTDTHLTGSVVTYTAKDGSQSYISVTNIHEASIVNGVIQRATVSDVILQASDFITTNISTTGVTTGGAGADHFVFSNAANPGVSTELDVILDFNLAEGDKIVLAGGLKFTDISFNNVPYEIAEGSLLPVSGFSYDANGVHHQVVVINTSDTAVNTSYVNLSASDFIFA